MSELIREHLIESKKQLENLANQIMLNDDDLEIDNRLFAMLSQKAENVIISEHLIDLANERVEDLEVYISDESTIEAYQKKLIDFLRKLVKAKL